MDFAQKTTSFLSKVRCFTGSAADVLNVAAYLINIRDTFHKYPWKWNRQPLKRNNLRSLPLVTNRCLLEAFLIDLLCRPATRRDNRAITLPLKHSKTLWKRQ